MDKTNEIFELMTKMYSEMQGMNERLTKLEDTVKSNTDKLDKGFNDITTRIDNFSTGLGKMITHEVADELSDKLREIKTDVKFIKHKVQETEEDVFTIQSHLKIIK